MANFYHLKNIFPVIACISFDRTFFSLSEPIIPNGFLISLYNYISEVCWGRGKASIKSLDVNSGSDNTPKDSPGVKYKGFFFLIFKIYLFMAPLGLSCCARAFSSCSERGLLFVAVASLVAEHGL